MSVENLNEIISKGENKSCGEVYEVNGFKGTKKEICKYFDINIDTIRAKQRNGKSFKESIIETLRNKEKQNRVYSFNGIKGSRNSICRHFGSTLSHIDYLSHKYKISFEEALKYYVENEKGK